MELSYLVNKIEVVLPDLVNKIKIESQDFVNKNEEYTLNNITGTSKRRKNLLYMPIYIKKIYEKRDNETILKVIPFNLYVSSHPFHDICSHLSQCLLTYV